MDGRSQFLAQADANLREHVKSRAKLIFPRHGHPEISIILVVADKAALIYECVKSILNTVKISYELIIANNGTSEAMGRLLGSLEGIRLVQNHGNVGFVRAVNRAVDLAGGSRYILLLNDDTVVTSGAISALLETIKTDDKIGAVGGKIILRDGKLQEAGSIVWQDGTGHGYGRGDDPGASEFNFRRDVDYCSGCLLLTHRDLFVQLGKFDEAFSPGYYEETDYCLRLWAEGYRVVYEPRATILHYEYGTNTQARAVELMNRNRPIFVERHPELRDHYPRGTDLLVARMKNVRRGRVLILDDRVPHPYLGSGYPRMAEIIREIHASGHFVTFYGLSPVHLIEESWDTVYQTLPREVEVFWNGASRLRQFLESRQYFYDIILLSRSHNMSALQRACAGREDLYSYAKLIYDAEAITCLRQHQRLRLAGKKAVTAQQEHNDLEREIAPARAADLVTAVSESEVGRFRSYGVRHTAVLGHKLIPQPTQAPFGRRLDFLFVGALYTNGSPNVDSLLWFAHRVWPVIRQHLGDKVKVFAVGQAGASDLKRIESIEGITVLGKCDGVIQYYNQFRVFIAPTRFAAGIPHKVHEAAAFGIPVVATPLLAEQLGWKNGQDLMVGQTEHEFAHACIRLYQEPLLWRSIRDHALARVVMDCSGEAFKKSVREIVRLDWKL